MPRLARLNNVCAFKIKVLNGGDNVTLRIWANGKTQVRVARPRSVSPGSSYRNRRSCLPLSPRFGLALVPALRASGGQKRSRPGRNAAGKGRVGGWQIAWAVAAWQQARCVAQEAPGVHGKPCQSIDRWRFVGVHAGWRGSEKLQRGKAACAPMLAV